MNQLLKDDGIWHHGFFKRGEIKNVGRNGVGLKIKYRENM